MKRKLHPKRRHGRSHISAKLRCDFRNSGYFGPLRKQGKLRTLFSRSEKIRMPDLIRAGYKGVSIKGTTDWTAVHVWIRQNCSYPSGLGCVWFGGTFFFAFDRDYVAFREIFDHHDTYVPMFAFEQAA